MPQPRSTVQARRIVNKLVLSSVMADDPRVGPRALAEPVQEYEGGMLREVESPLISTAVRSGADWEMERRLNEVRFLPCCLHRRTV